MDFEPAGRKCDDIIILAIDERFAEQIYSGEKVFEFRKTPIPRNLNYVLLLENGTRELSGGFRVKEVHERRVNDLWTEFGEGVSSYERFFEYYDDWNEGIAIEIGSTERFKEPISVEYLNSEETGLTVPEQFHFVYLTEKVLPLIATESELIQEFLPITESTTLDRFGTNTAQDGNSSLNFRPMLPKEEDTFKRLFLDSPVPDAYAEISEEFVDHIIQSHNKGNDPYGYFTLKKKVYTLLERREIIGFTTTTWKRGNSVKYGPTMLKDSKQGLGMGPKLRKLIDSRLTFEGVRKSYSTIPDNAPHAYKYLLKSNYEIEAHMRSQYHEDHGELVFGKVLNGGIPERGLNQERKQVERVSFQIGSQDFDHIDEFIIDKASPWYDGIDLEFVRSIIDAEKRGLAAAFSKKGKRIYIGHSADEIRCIAIASLKRGGGVKVSPVFSEVMGEALRTFWHRLEGDLMEVDNVRKIYTHIPVLDQEMVSFFRKEGFKPEGLLREPYKDGIDMVFLGKLVE